MSVLHIGTQTLPNKQLSSPVRSIIGGVFLLAGSVASIAGGAELSSHTETASVVEISHVIQGLGAIGLGGAVGFVGSGVLDARSQRRAVRQLVFTSRELAPMPLGSE